MATTNRCTVCHHPKRAEIERQHVGGATIRELAKRFGRNKSTIQAHLSKHVPDAARKAADAAEEREVTAGDAILAELADLKKIARALLNMSANKGDYRTAIAAVRELARQIELKARLLGQLRDREVSITNVNIDPETGERLARMFIARREAKRIDPPANEGQQPVIDLEVISNEREK